MILEQFLNFLIDANLLILVATAAFLSVEACLVAFGHRRSYATRLWLLSGSLGFALLLPLLPYGIAAAKISVPHVSDLLISQYLKGNISISAVNFDTLLSARTATIQALHSGSSPWVTGIAALVVTAVVGRLVYILINVVRITGAVRNGCCIRSTGRVKIIVSSEIDVPFSTRGLRVFYVVVPQGLTVDAKTMAIAIGHELQHIRQRDITVEVVLALVSPLFVLNPGFWLLSQKLRKLREHTCDEAFLKRSHHGARDYAKALLMVAKQAAQSRRFSRIGSLSVPFIGRNLPFSKTTKSALLDRVLAVADGEAERPSKVLASGLLLVAAAIMVFGAAAFSPTTGWSHDRIMISSVANLERLSLRNTSNASGDFQAITAE